MSQTNQPEDMTEFEDKFWQSLAKFFEKGTRNKHCAIAMFIPTYNKQMVTIYGDKAYVKKQLKDIAYQIGLDCQDL